MVDNDNPEEVVLALTLELATCLSDRPIMQLDTWGAQIFCLDLSKYELWAHEGQILVYTPKDWHPEEPRELTQHVIATALKRRHTRG